MPNLSDVFNLNLFGLGIVVFRTLVVYFALLAGLRVAGKRELGQMTPFDLIVVLIISNAVQNAMVGPDTSLTGGLIAAGTLLGVNALINRTSLKLTWLGHNLVGTPTVLINDGKFIEEHLRHEGLQRSEVLMAMREHGVAEVDQVRMAVLEVDGSISIVPKEGGTVHRTQHRLRGRKPI